MTSAQTLIDQELAQFGWVDSVATNSISDFKSPKSIEESSNKKNSDLLDAFIFHLIFYFIFCYSLFLYIVFDLGISSFVEKKVNRLIKFEMKENIPSSIQAQSH